MDDTLNFLPHLGKHSLLRFGAGPQVPLFTHIWRPRYLSNICPTLHSDLACFRLSHVETQIPSSISWESNGPVGERLGFIQYRCIKQSPLLSPVLVVGDTVIHKTKSLLS